MQVQICNQKQVLNKDGKYGVNKLAAIPDPEAPHGTLKVRFGASEWKSDHFSFNVFP